MADNTPETDHSKEAERLLRLANHVEDHPDSSFALAAAQVHATLAIAAAIDRANGPIRVHYDYDVPGVPARLEYGRLIDPQGCTVCGIPHSSLLPHVTNPPSQCPTCLAFHLLGEPCADPLDDPTIEVPDDVTREVPRFGGAS